MTDQNRDPQNDLPSFSVNVVPTHKITAAHLGALIERYREGQIEPLVFGEDNKPEAAVIPFAAFVRLLKHDRATANAEQAELARHIREADASDDPGLSLQELGDLARMNQAALKNPHGEQEALLEATIIMLHRLNGRRHPTKPLDYDSRFADLSDCDTTYVGADPYEKPPLRIVSRDLRPDRPGGITRREIIAVGQRRDSEVYRIAGQRLGRPVGVTLQDLEAQSRSAPAAPARQVPRTTGFAGPEPEREDSQPGLG